MASSAEVVGPARRQMSQVVKGYDKFEDEHAVNYVFATVDVKEGVATGEVIDPIGTALVWESGVSAFIPYEGGTEVADAITDGNAVNSDGVPLVGGTAVVGVSVGQMEGKGFNKADLTLSSTAQQITIMYRGQSVVKDGPIPATGGEGIQWFSTVDAAEALLFKNQLDIQGVGIFPISTEVVTPTFV
jgi:hypothetical protein